MPRILHVLGGFGYGGTERFCLNLLKHRDFGSPSVVVGIDPTRTGMEPSFRALPEVSVLRGPGRRHLDVYRWMIGVLRSERPDGVIVHAFGIVHLTVALAARRAGVWPVLVSAGNPPPSGRGRWKWKLVILGSRFLRVPIQACSQTVMNELRGLGVGLPAGSGAILYGIEVEEFAKRAEAARAVRVGRDPLVIGMVARLDEIKDQATLIRAFARLVRDKSMPRAELWLVGDGVRRDELEALARDEAAYNSVKFLGFRDDIPELLGQMDLYAFSTTPAEGFGIALAEAMAAGLPIIASDVPACREVLQNGTVGMLVVPGDADAWASALVSCLDEPQRREALGRAASRVAIEQYSSELCHQRWGKALRSQMPGRLSLWDKVIRGSPYRKTRFHSEKGVFGIRNVVDIVDMLRSFFGHLIRLATGRIPIMPWLTYPAIRFIRFRIDRQSRVFEFGGGMSSIYFHNICGEVHTVESNEDWYDRLRQRGVSNIYLASDDAFVDKVRDYPEQYFDVIVVDGNVDRKRCFFAAEPHLKRGGLLVLDDSDKHQIVPGPIRELDIWLEQANSYRLERFTGWVPGSFWVKETTIAVKQ